MPRANSWTEAEDAIIREMYGREQIDTICRRLFREVGTTRQTHAVRRRAAALGLATVRSRSGGRAYGRRHPWRGPLTRPRRKEK